MAAFPLYAIQPDKGFLMSKPIWEQVLEMPLFVIVESPAANNETTLADKSPICSLSTHKPKSSKTSVQDSTLKGRDCVPYWTDFLKGISSQLLLPAKTDCADLDSSLYNTWSSKTVEASWFSTRLYTVRNQNLPRIYSPLSTSSLVECTDSENTARKSKKIRIYLNPKQKSLVKKWMGVSRFVFNKTVEHLQQPDAKANWKAIKGGLLSSLPEWCKEIPYQIKSIAIKDACTAVREAKKKYKKTGQIPQVKFRSRKDRIQSCYIPKSAVTDLGIYQTILGKIRYTEKLPDNIGDCRLVFHHGQHYICVPHDVPRQTSENQGRVVALDPGVRSFLTLFTEDSFGWIGTGDIGRIQRLCCYLDDLISRITKAKAKQRRRLKKAADRLRLRIRHLIDEMHHQVARFLVDNFDVILLPRFEVSQMVVKSTRNLRSKSVRQMLSWAHYRFEMFLKQKAFETGKVVLDCHEAYTSKTVSWTGEIIPNLGGKKVIVGSDGFRMDRDINGARGIFLRALGDIPSLRACLLECIVSKC